MKTKHKFHVWCNRPNGNQSIIIASFQGETDAVEFAEMKTKQWKERFYSNNGSYVTDNFARKITEFNIN